MPIDFRPFINAEGLSGWNLGVPRWPAWAKVCLFIPMIPGILLLAFAILALGVSIVALFVLTLPVYMFLTRTLGVGRVKPQVRSGGVKHVEATIRDV